VEEYSNKSKLTGGNMRAFLAIALMVLSAATCFAQTAAQEAELNAYIEILEIEIKAGRMSLEQGKYLAIQSANQIRERYQSQQRQEAAQRQARDAAALNALGAAINGLNQSARPIFPPSSSGPNLNCTTYQRGPYGSINCF
jgi:hypothetical protein